MIRDEIIRLAEQCGIPEFDNNESQAENILRFAALVRADERESCARMAEAFHQHGYDFTGDLELHDAIRARGQV